MTEHVRRFFAYLVAVLILPGLLALVLAPIALALVQLSPWWLLLEPVAIAAAATLAEWVADWGNS